MLTHLRVLDLLCGAMHKYLWIVCNRRLSKPVSTRQCQASCKGFCMQRGPFQMP